MAHSIVDRRRLTHTQTDTVYPSVVWPLAPFGEKILCRLDRVGPVGRWWDHGCSCVLALSRDVRARNRIDLGIAGLSAPMT